MGLLIEPPLFSTFCIRFYHRDGFARWNRVGLWSDHRAVLYLSLEEIVWRNLLQFNTGALGVLIVLLVLYLPKGVLSLRIASFWKMSA